MSHAKRQHWVPRFYLSSFRTEAAAASADAQVWLFDRKKGDPKIAHIKNVCVEGYLYAPQDESGQRSFSVEERLSKLESLLGEIWPSVTDGFPDLNGLPIRQALSLFVATLYLRNPQRLEQYESAHKSLVTFFANGPLNANGIPACEAVIVDNVRIPFDTSGWDRFVGQGAVDQRHAFVNGVMTHAGKLAQLLLKKRWTIVVSDAPVFATSDAPVSLSHPTRSAFGFGTPGVSISLPLSPTRLLILGDPGLPNGYYSSKDGFAGAVNHETWVNADRYLLSAFDTDIVLRGIMAFVDSLPKQSAA